MGKSIRRIWGILTAVDMNYIYDKTNGHCEYCGKKIAFVNYGKVGERGSWEVDHSNPRSRGGTDYLRNLYPACIDCNRNKGVRTGKCYRASFSSCAPQTVGSSIGEIIVGSLLVYLIYQMMQSMNAQR